MLQSKHALSLWRIYDRRIPSSYSCPSCALVSRSGTVPELRPSIGLHADTLADGLQVARSSGFVGKAIGHLISGLYTVTDEELSLWTHMLYTSEKMPIEHYYNRHGIDPTSVAHLIWAQAA